MEVNWSTYLSNMNAYDFAHTMGGTRIYPLKEEQIKAIEAKLLLFSLEAGPLADAVKQDPEARKNLESIFVKIFNERKLRVFYGFKADDCERMEGLAIKLQDLFESVHPGQFTFKGISTPKKGVEEPPKLPPVEMVDESLLRDSLACLSRVNDPKKRIKQKSSDDEICIRTLLGKVIKRLNAYPTHKISDEILENMARLFEKMDNLLTESEYSVLRLCLERNIAVPNHLLAKMIKHCQYKDETMRWIDLPHKSLAERPRRLFRKLLKFKPDFSNELSAEKTRQTLSIALKTILAIPEQNRQWVHLCLNSLKERLIEMPADACSSIQDFFQKDVPIQFLDKIVPCKLSDILNFCSFSPVLYLAWKKNLDNTTSRVNFEKFGITYDDYEALKNDCYTSESHLKNPFVGMALWHYLDVPKLEEVYAKAADRSNASVDEICEAYRKGFIPEFAKLPRFETHLLSSLGRKIVISSHLPEVLTECLLIGSKIANEKGKDASRKFVNEFFYRIPDILKTLRQAVEEQLFEDMQDCESCIHHLVSLLESFERCYDLSREGFIDMCIQIYQSLLAFDKTHPIPHIMERYGKKLDVIIRSENVPMHQVCESLISHNVTLNNQWLCQKFLKDLLMMLEKIDPQSYYKKYLDLFEAVIDVESQPELKEIAKMTQHFFPHYIKMLWWVPERFEHQMAKLGRLQTALASDEDEFILILPKFELDLRDTCSGHYPYNKERLTSIAAHLKVDKIILKKKGWFGKDGLTSDECAEVEKMFAKFPKGTIVWV